MSPEAICSAAGGVYSEAWSLFGLHRGQKCTVVAQGIVGSKVPERRNACLEGLALPGRRSGTDCYTATRNGDGTVTTDIHLDDACIADAGKWFTCISDNPVSEEKQETSGGSGEGEYLPLSRTPGHAPGSLLSAWLR